MPKYPSQKLWQFANKDKVTQYQKKYFEDKVRVSIVLDKDLVEQIEQVKPADEAYSAWIKRTVKEWLTEHCL